VVRHRLPPAAFGLALTSVLVLLAFGVPHWFDWQVWARAPRSVVPHEVPPLHGYWQPKVGVGTLPAVLLALAGWRWAPVLAERLRWRPLLAASYAVGLAWLVSLALVDGTDGLSRQLGNRFEYLRTARDVTSVSALLHEYVDRIPLHAADAWPTHVAGHPPGMLLVFVGLDRIGLGGDLAAGLVVTAAAASTSVAVLVALRALGREGLAGRAAPFLVLAPAAVFMAVSADALLAAVCAWGVAALALAGRCSGRRMVAWSVVAGLLLGYAVLMSYGAPLVGLVALGVLLAGRRWWPLPIAAVTAAAVVGGFAVAGFAWWRAFPVLHDRYWAGIAADRPASYWLWGNLAALAVSAGPLVGAGVAQLVGRVRGGAGRVDPAVLATAGAALAAVVLADVSLMSKAEVERIWLPFVPWLLVSVVLLPPGWRRWGLGIQLLGALVVQHLLYTSW
jgi:hypothetical protein